MRDFLLALVLMFVVVVPLIGWAVRKDRRRRQTGDSSLHEKEGVA
jgi:hypothetical protein